MKRIITITLSIALICAILTACEAKTGSSRDLTEGIKPSTASAEKSALSEEDSIAATDFALRLFTTTASSDENTLISPVSVFFALAMTANGANGETRAQMERTLGMSVPEMNNYLHSYMTALPQDDKYTLHIANAIWLKDDDSFTANEDFLQTNADYYGAGIYAAPFDDTTCRDINNWVNENTNGMIPELLDEIQPSAVMYLINAISFDAEWQTIYNESQIQKSTFTTESGTKQDIELMYSDEFYYIADDKATGFIKPYADEKYAFVALLPNEGVSVAEYLSSLSGADLHSMLSAPQEINVKAAIPKFNSEYDVEMIDILKKMGITTAFDEHAADFSNLCQSSEGNIYIDLVLHKAKITVDEKGTKAGAATAVGLNKAALAPEDKRVILDCPFVYMIVDRQSNLPLFIGTAMSVD